MSGTVKECDPWKVAVAVYLYGEEVILRCDMIDYRTQEFTLDIPEVDWSQVVSDYTNGVCSLGDAKAFVAAWHQVMPVLKRVKTEGSYCSPAWIAGRGV